LSLEPLEAQLAAVIAEHPEYVAWLESGEEAVGTEFTPEGVFALQCKAGRKRLLFRLKVPFPSSLAGTGERLARTNQSGLDGDSTGDRTEPTL
jgi:hypothetical protein